MSRRLMLGLVVMASLSMIAAPALGASTYHIREQGSGLSAGFTNAVFGEEESPPPGDYFSTYVFVASHLAAGSEGYQSDYLCVEHWTFSVDANGDWVDGSGLFACGEADTLSVDRRLESGHVTASLVVEDCLAWDEETGECLEPIVLGTLEVDLILTGEGAIERYHGTSSGGIAGLYQSVYHGTGVARGAVPSGTVALDGDSLIDGATLVDAQLYQTKTGYVEISH